MSDLSCAPGKEEGKGQWIKGRKDTVHIVNFITYNIDRRYEGHVVHAVLFPHHLPHPSMSIMEQTI
jgi:hypothetical protein